MTIKPLAAVTGVASLLSIGSLKMASHVTIHYLTVPACPC